MPGLEYHLPIVPKQFLRSGSAPELALHLSLLRIQKSVRCFVIEPIKYSWL
jgi:hypothetical protein